MPIYKLPTGILFFAHVPKCGGSSVEQYLKKRFGAPSFYDTRFRGHKGRAWTKTSPQHATAQAISHLFTNNFFDYKVAVVRHPVDRALSAYKFQMDREKTIPKNVSFDEFVDKYLSNDEFRTNPRFDNHLLTQNALVPEGTKIFRLEDGLDKVLKYIDELAGLVGNHAAVPHTNKSANTSVEISEPARRKIEEIYAEDFRRFGYEEAIAEMVVASPYVKDKKPEISILTPKAPDQAHQSGEAAYSKGLKSAFLRAGYTANIYGKGQWRNAKQDSVNILLRGHPQLNFRPTNFTICLNLADHGNINGDEIHNYDLMLASSPLHLQNIQKRWDIPVALVPQAFDKDVMYLSDQDDEFERIDAAAMVGTLWRWRNLPILVSSLGIETNLWGEQKKMLELPKSLQFHTQPLPNEQVREVYSKYKIILNDHFPAMRRSQIQSNRAYDAIACGSMVLCNDVAWYPSDLEGYIKFANNKDDILAAIDARFSESKAEQKRRNEFAKGYMTEHHSFDSRVPDIMNAVESVTTSKPIQLKD